MSKKHLSTGLACMSLIFTGVFMWRDHSRRTKTQSVKRAADTPQGTMDVATLIWALESNSEPVKRDAAKVVARMGTDAKDALPALIEVLSTADTSYTYRTHVPTIIAIGSMGPQAEPAVPLLVGILNETNSPGFPDSRDRAAIIALSQIGPAAVDSIPTLLDRLNRQNPIVDSSERRATIRALAMIAPTAPNVVAAVTGVEDALQILDDLRSKLESDSKSAKRLDMAIEAIESNQKNLRQNGPDS